MLMPFFITLSSISQVLYTSILAISQAQYSYDIGLPFRPYNPSKYVHHRIIFPPKKCHFFSFQRHFFIYINFFKSLYYSHSLSLPNIILPKFFIHIFSYMGGKTKRTEPRLGFIISTFGVSIQLWFVIIMIYLSIYLPTYLPTHPLTHTGIQGHE